MRVKDSIIGLGSILFGIMLFYLTIDFPSLEGGHPGPALFPRILALLFTFFGTSLFIQGVKAKETREIVVGASPSWGEVVNAISVIGAVVFYILFVEHLGFLLTSLLLLALLMKKLGVTTLKSVVFSVLMTIGVYVLFGKMLRVPLPWGLISW